MAQGNRAGRPPVNGFFPVHGGLSAAEELGSGAVFQGAPWEKDLAGVAKRRGREAKGRGSHLATAPWKESPCGRRVGARARGTSHDYLVGTVAIVWRIRLAIL